MCETRVQSGLKLRRVTLSSKLSLSSEKSIALYFELTVRVNNPIAALRLSLIQSVVSAGHDLF